MGALVTHQRSSTILDKGPSSDFRMTFSWGLCTFTAHLSRPRSITLSPYLQTWICPWPQTLQLLKQHTAWTLLTATRVITILDSGIWGRCHSSFSEPYYHAWLTTLEKSHHFQHYVADIDNVPQQVARMPSACWRNWLLKVCLKRSKYRFMCKTEWSHIFYQFQHAPSFSTLVVSNLSHSKERW